MILTCPHCQCQVDCTGISGAVACPRCRQQFIVPPQAAPLARVAAAPVAPIANPARPVASAPPLPPQSAAPDPFAGLVQVVSAEQASAKRPLSGWDRQFANFGPVAMILLPLLCNGPALLLGIFGLVVCQNRKAKSNAKSLVVFSGVVTGVGVLGAVAFFFVVVADAVNVAAQRRKQTQEQRQQPKTKQQRSGGSSRPQSIRFDDSASASANSPTLPADFAFAPMTVVRAETDLFNAMQPTVGNVGFRIQAAGKEVCLTSGRDEVRGLHGKGLQVRQELEGVLTNNLKVKFFWKPEPFACYRDGRLLGIWDTHTTRFRSAATGEAEAAVLSEKSAEASESEP